MKLDRWKLLRRLIGRAFWIYVSALSMGFIVGVFRPYNGARLREELDIRNLEILRDPEADIDRMRFALVVRTQHAGRYVCSMNGGSVDTIGSAARFGTYRLFAGLPRPELRLANSNRRKLEESDPSETFGRNDPAASEAIEGAGSELRAVKFVDHLVTLLNAIGIGHSMGTNFRASILPDEVPSALEQPESQKLIRQLAWQLMVIRCGMTGPAFTKFDYHSGSSFTRIYLDLAAPEFASDDVPRQRELLAGHGYGWYLAELDTLASAIARSRQPESLTNADFRAVLRVERLSQRHLTMQAISDSIRHSTNPEWTGQGEWKPNRYISEFVWRNIGAEWGYVPAFLVEDETVLPNRWKNHLPPG